MSEHDKPTFSKRQLDLAVMACCTCGGGVSGTKGTCPACEVYHALNKSKEKAAEATGEICEPKDR
jgi:predicted ATP-dependent serine protease